MKVIKEILYGFAFGLANIIPGVSGGTFALVLGFYERLIHFLKALNLRSIIILLKKTIEFITGLGSKEKRRSYWVYLSENDWVFMSRLACGALLCILLLSACMKYLLQNHFEYTYAFFFGLILLSIGVPLKLIRRKKLSVFVNLMAGLMITVALTVAVNPLDKTVSKSQLYEKRYLLEQSIEASEEKNTDFSAKYTTQEYGQIFFAGMVSVSAMVLPGISGSLMLILMNQYVVVISAIANLKSLQRDEFMFLGIFALGMLIGILLAARVIEFFLKKFHDATMGFLTGLIIGSLYALWPFKKFKVMDIFIKGDTVIEKLESIKVYTNINTLPDEMFMWVPVLLLVLLGAACMLFFLKQESGKS